MAYADFCYAKKSTQDLLPAASFRLCPTRTALAHSHVYIHGILDRPIFRNRSFKF